MSAEKKWTPGKIVTDYDASRPHFALWAAIDAETYDGAPDAGPISGARGLGRTEEEAIADLKEQIEGWRGE